MPIKIVTETTGEIMLKVIIADDEPKVNLLLQKIVDWEKLGYQIAGTAAGCSDDRYPDAGSGWNGTDPAC